MPACIPQALGKRGKNVLEVPPVPNFNITQAETRGTAAQAPLLKLSVPVCTRFKRTDGFLGVVPVHSSGCRCRCMQHEKLHCNLLRYAHLGIVTWAVIHFERLSYSTQPAGCSMV